ncbi:MAG: hypothetical protein JWQ09_5082 [Segetibacter sp.]|nr:hypothetical protein [Segetibacter sp.]
MSEIKNKIVVPEKIHLQSIRVLNGSIMSDPEIETTAAQGFTTIFEVQTGIDLPNEGIRFVFKVTLNGTNENDEPIEVKAEYTLEFSFQIEELEGYIVKQNEETKELILQAPLGGTLMAIVYSTSRGIILTRTQGTILDGIILPVIDPMKLFTQQE